MNARNQAARLLPPGSEWDAALTRLAAHGLNDVYFDWRYVALYAGDDGTPAACIYDDGADLFFFPFLHRPIPGTDRRDFETAYGYGGPLATTERADFLAAAWRGFGDVAADLRLIAGLVRFHPLLKSERFAVGGPLTPRPERATVFLRLNQSPEAVWRGYADDNRRKIRKAERLGLRVERDDASSALATFADLYHDRMTALDAHADYFFGNAYFAAVADLGAGRRLVYRAVVDNETIAGALVLLGPRFAHYHLSAGKAERFAFAPNNALRHAVVCDHLNGGREALHFGGGLTGAADDGLFAFKRKFSPDAASFFIGGCVLDPDAYQSLRDAWRRTAAPDAVDRYGGYVLCYRF